MAECPSGRYLAEIVTPGGLTLERPTTDDSGMLGGLLDWSASELKFADWDTLTKTLIGRLERSWLAFSRWPTSPGMPEYNGYVAELNSIRKRYSEIRKPWVNDSSAVGTTGYTWGITLPEIAFDATEEIGALTAICVDAQCLRQRLDEALESAGGNPVTPGATAHKPAASMGILGTIALVVGGGAVATGLIILARKVGK